MRSKNFITKCMVGCLALLMVFSFVGCKEEKTPDYKEEKTLFETQYENSRYYCQQGYDANTWDVKEGNNKYYLKNITEYADGTAVNYNDCGLVAQFSPKAAADKATYSIYSLKGNFMRATLSDILMGLVGKNSYKFEFNNLFLADEENTPRNAFVWTIDVEDTQESLKETTKSYNKLNFQQVPYTFTVDGVNWKGMMLVTLGKEGFYVITLEMEANTWDTYYAEMEKMLNDFRMLGWETENS